MADAVSLMLFSSKTDLPTYKPGSFPDVLRSGGREAAIILLSVSEFKPLAL